MHEAQGYQFLNECCLGVYCQCSIFLKLLHLDGFCSFDLAFFAKLYYGIHERLLSGTVLSGNKPYHFRSRFLKFQLRITFSLAIILAHDARVKGVDKVMKFKAPILWLIMLLSIYFHACTAINMQTYYKLKSSETATVTNTIYRQSNPTPPAFFIAFTDNHIYSFNYRDIYYDVYSPVKTTNYSTFLGPLIFPVFPVGLIGEIFDPKQKSNYIKEIVVHAHSLLNDETYRRNLSKISLVNMNDKTSILSNVNYNTAKDESGFVYAILTFNFDKNPPRCFKLILDSDMDASPYILYCKARVPSISMGVW
jgi:hypothetical protein